MEQKIVDPIKFAEGTKIKVADEESASSVVTEVVGNNST